MVQQDATRKPSPGPETANRHDRDYGTPKVHVKSRVLTVVLDISGGSPTEVMLDIANCGGFLAAYGDMGAEKLRSLSATIGQSVETWLSRNPASFGIG